MHARTHVYTLQAVQPYIPVCNILPAVCTYVVPAVCTVVLPVVCTTAACCRVPHLLDADGHERVGLRLHAAHTGDGLDLGQEGRLRGKLGALLLITPHAHAHACTAKQATRHTGMQGGERSVARQYRTGVHPTARQLVRSRV